MRDKQSAYTETSDDESCLPYADRDQAADVLSGALSHLAGRDAVVLAIPRGAVPMRAALGWARRRRPAKLVCAVPVADAESLASLADLADEIVCPRPSRALFSISQFYLRFPQVSDEEVLSALTAHPSGRSSSKRDVSDPVP